MSDQPTGKPGVAMMVADDELFALAANWHAAGREIFGRWNDIDSHNEAAVSQSRLSC